MKLYREQFKEGHMDRDAEGGRMAERRNRKSDAKKMEEIHQKAILRLC